MKKIGSIIKFNNKDMKLKIGTVDKKNPEVIYLEGGFYVKPIVQKEKNEYKYDINQIKNVFEDLIKDCINKEHMFDKEYMFFSDIAYEWLKLDKESFLSFQIYLKPSTNILEKEKNFSNVMKYVKDNFNYNISVKEIFEKYGYEISKTKAK